MINSVLILCIRFFVYFGLINIIEILDNIMIELRKLNDSKYEESKRHKKR